MVQELRQQFCIYLISESSTVLALEEEIASCGYQLTNFVDSEEVWHQLSTQPPHVVVLDTSIFKSSEESQAFEARKYIDALHKKSPETLVIALVSQSDHGLQLEDSVYDFQLRSMARAKILVKSIDRACEKLSYLYRIEQLVERIDQVSSASTSKSNGSTVQVANDLKDQVDKLTRLPSHSLLDNHSVAALHHRWIDLLQKSNGGLTSLFSFLDFCGKEIGNKNVLFFKSIRKPSSLAVSQTSGMDIEKLRGVGFHLPIQISSQHDAEKINLSIEKLKDFLVDALKVSQSEVFPFFNKEDFEGFIVVCNDFSSVQEHDIFLSCLGMLNLFVEYKNAVFERDKNRTLSSTTQLLMREPFYRRAKEEIARARRLQLPVSLISLSIDQFESYKRRLGEGFARKIQKIAAEVLQKTSRVEDTLSDLGHGEFAILLPHTDQQGAKLKAEKIRRIIESVKIHQLNSVENAGITVSLGLSEYPSACSGVDSLIKSAEDSLFFIQKQGGNQVCLASPVASFKPDFRTNNGVTL